MSTKTRPPPRAQLVRTDTTFANAVHAACTQRALSRDALAAQAHVPLAAVHAIYRRAPVSLERVSTICRLLELPLPRLVDMAPLLRLGRLVRERRHGATLTRKALGQLANLSEGTIKFIETGLHLPSRKTCLRLLGVDVLGIQWEDLTPFIGPPQEVPVPGARPPAFPLTPGVSREMVLEQMLLTDQLRLHQYGVESSPAGWRRLCWFCGARLAHESLRPEEAPHLAVRHARACTGQLTVLRASSLQRRIGCSHHSPAREVRFGPTRASCPSIYPGTLYRSC